MDCQLAWIFSSGSHQEIFKLLKNCMVENQGFCWSADELSFDEIPPVYTWYLHVKKYELSSVLK